MWIDYCNNNWEGFSSVPLYTDNAGSVGFADGAYDVFDYYFDDESGDLMRAWEATVLNVVIPKLMAIPQGQEIIEKINSEEWTFKFANRDNYGST